MTHYLGWYIGTHGYVLNPAPSYIAWCFGTGMFRAVAEAAARRGVFSVHDDDPARQAREHRHGERPTSYGNHGTH